VGLTVAHILWWATKKGGAGKVSSGDARRDGAGAHGARRGPTLDLDCARNHCRYNGNRREYWAEGIDLPSPSYAIVLISIVGAWHETKTLWTPLFLGVRRIFNPDGLPGSHTPAKQSCTQLADSW